MAGTLAWGLLAPGAVAAQNPHPISHKLRIFLDCQDNVCDMDFTKRALDHVEFVREHAVADLHLLLTYRPTAAGGREYELHLSGISTEVTGAQFVLKTTTAVAATDDDTRRQLVELFKVALAPFVSQTPEGALQEVQFTNASPQLGPVPGIVDPWNHWVFQTSLAGLGIGEQTYRQDTLNVNASANRVTAAWKLNNILSYSRASSRFKIPGAPDVQSLQSGLSFDTLIGKSIGDHWSVGADATVASSSFLNESFYFRSGPIVEYDLFPYDQSSTRQLIVQYGAGVRSYSYTDQTIFLKDHEVFGDQLLRSSLSVRRTWGTVSFGGEYAVLLPKVDKYHVTGFGNVDVRVTKGLAVRVGGSVAAVHDQVYLAREGATIDEILLRQRQLATSYSYVVMFGVTYTFGSIFNSIVNPRFIGVSAAGF